MSTSFLTTKLYVPQVRPERLDRPRLIRKLGDGLDAGHRLILLSAPASFGKATLLSDWLGHRQSPAAWLSLDEHDNEPARCWAHLIAALQSVYAGLGQAILQLLQSVQPVPNPTLLSPHLNEMVACAADPAASRFLLVLDDYYQILSPSIHEGIAFLLAYQPPNLHPVVASSRLEQPGT